MVVINSTPCPDFEEQEKMNSTSTIRITSPFSTTPALFLLHKNLFSFPIKMKQFQRYKSTSNSNFSNFTVKRKGIQQSKPSSIIRDDAAAAADDDCEFEDDEPIDGDDEYFEDEFDEANDDDDPHAGDGAGGGGFKFAGTLWDKKVLALAEDVCKSNGDWAIYAFRTLVNLTIRVRIVKLSNKSGSPGMTDIEAFSAMYKARLDEAELAGLIPKDISLEVSSPGVERVVRIPQDLDRFKERPMYVKYVDEIQSTESDGIFKLVSYDMETKCCVWGIADVRLNREKAGKGRPLNKKQREWRLSTPFDSLQLVRIYSDI